MRSTCLGYTAERASVAAELARCEREIAAMDGQHDAPAFLVTLGVEDWEAEKRLIAKEGDENWQKS